MEKNLTLGVFGIVLTLLAGMAWGISAARFLPELVDVNPWWWFIFGLLLLARQVYKLFVR